MTTLSATQRTVDIDRKPAIVRICMSAWLAMLLLNSCSSCISDGLIPLQAPANPVTHPESTL